MSTARVDFTRGAAERIANAVRLVETGSRDGAAFFPGRALDTPTGKTFRVCKFTGSWSIDSFKTVSFKYQTSTPNTVTAINLFLELPDDGEKNCAIAKDGTAWHLVQWQWVTITCGTATASP